MVVTLDYKIYVGWCSCPDAEAFLRPRMKLSGGYYCRCRRCNGIIFNGNAKFLVERYCHEVIHIVIGGLFEDWFEAGIVNSCLDFLIRNMKCEEGEQFRPLWYPDPGS